MEKRIKELRTPDVDVKNSVMDKIKKDKIKMKNPFVFLAQKLGLQSILVLVILMGSLLVSSTLYFLKKTGVLKFLSFGLPGLKVVLYTLPYDYIALFLVTLILAIYIIKKLDFDAESKIFLNAPVVTLLLVTVFIGTFFALMGIEQLMKGWSKDNLPEHMAVHGRVINSARREITIKTGDGRVERIIFDDEAMFPYKDEYARNKFLRAIGRADEKNKELFHADQIICCESGQ